MTDDTYAIYGAHFFIRSVLELPIKGFTDWFGFGVRVSQKRETFYAYLDDFDSAENGPLFGWLSTRIDHYSEDTLNLNTKARFCGGGKRPLIELEPTDHPLAVAQRGGSHAGGSGDDSHYYTDHEADSD